MRPGLFAQACNNPVNARGGPREWRHACPFSGLVFRRPDGAFLYVPGAASEHLIRDFVRHLLDEETQVAAGSIIRRSNVPHPIGGSDELIALPEAVSARVLGIVN